MKIGYARTSYHRPSRPDGERERANAQADAIFEAVSGGTKNPIKHDAAVKSDYDLLIKELGKLGWKRRRPSSLF